MNLRNNIKPFIIAGPCSMESEELCIDIAKTLDSICHKYGFTYIFKSSFDKSNRTSANSFRGPGLTKGIKILDKVRQFTQYTTTDVHEPGQSKAVSPVVDIIQIPAFLARQTNLLIEAGETGKWVNIKKPQFLSADKMIHVVNKVKSTENQNIILTERGTMHGPSDIVVDFRNIIEMKSFNDLVVIDATHSCQKLLPGNHTSGNRSFAPFFAKAGVLFGASGVFLEVHPNPDKGLSDPQTMINYEMFDQILSDLSNEN
ncbi:3-deoxy-8-phosphooctulonate synthase [bacterium]|nr:3-deoxy-8-phosphooctulonate synthase [bacterium]